jgi:AraC family ethanolamine operon transcriptional activator
MQRKDPKSFILNDRFTDFEEFAQATRAWDLDFIQLDRGNFETEIIQVGVDDVLLTQASLNRFIDQKGSSPPGLWTFAILTDKSSDIIWRGRKVGKKSLMIYAPGSEIDAQSRARFDVYTLSYPESLLNELAQMFEIPSFRKLIEFSDLFTAKASELLKCREQTKHVLSAIKEQPKKLNGKAMLDEMKFGLPQQLISTLVFSRPEYNKPSHRKRDRALRRAKAYLTEHARKPVTVRDLCRVTEVSERTLRYAFLEQFGTSPKSYLLAMRLNGVRRQLSHADPSLATIADVANHWGFWHMGQFAADYRRLFGELPSETLRREGGESQRSPH